jgi:colanic acid/amylovoran biosynthesis protein
MSGSGFSSSDGAMTGRAKRICLMGASLDNGNLGVQALAASLIRLIVEADSGAQISLLYGGRQERHHQYLEVGDREVAVDVLNYRMSPRAKLRDHILWILLLALFQRLLPSKGPRERIIKSNPTLDLLCSSGLIGDIRGGDSFSDIYGLRGFVNSNVPLLIVMLLGKKYVLLPQTYGPFKSAPSRIMARFVLRRASRVYARDLISLSVIKDLVAAGDRADVVTFCPDVAFSLASKNPPKPKIEPPLDLADRPNLIGLNVSGLLYNGGFTRDNMFGLKYDYKDFVQRLVVELMEKTDSHVLLVPHTAGSAENWHVESDPFACHSIANSMPERFKTRLHVVIQNYNQSETKGIIGLCSFFIGSRMHACIAALSQGIPAVGVAYSRKFKGVFDCVGLGDMVLDGPSLGLETTVSEIIRLYKDRESYRHIMAAKVETVKQQLRETFRGLICGPGSTESLTSHGAQS